MSEYKSFLWITNYNKGYTQDIDHIFSLEPYQIQEHLTTFAVVFLLFSALYILNKKAFEQFQWFNSKSQEEKNSIVWLFNANIHHLGCFVFGIVNVFFICEGKLDSLLAEETCMLTYKSFYSHTAFWSLSYFCFDFVMMVFVIKDTKTALAKQTLAHHFLGISCILFGNLAGEAMCKLSQMSMLCEISQIFLNIRNTLGKKQKSTIAFVNNIVFFLTYTFFRIFYFPFVLYAQIVSPIRYDYLNTRSNLHVFFVWWIIIAFSGIIALNLFWYWLILKGLAKMFKKQQTDNEDEDDQYRYAGKIN